MGHNLMDVGDFDRLCLRLKERNARKRKRKNSDMDHNWIDRYFESVHLRIGLRNQLKYPRSEIKNQSIDLDASLKMLSQEASCVAGNWTDVNIKYDDRRSFRGFLLQLEISGLEKYVLNKWLPLEVLPPDDLVIAADKYYDRSLSLIQLMQRIRSESGDDFRREQATLLESFLDNLIKIQEEQQLVSYTFSKNLEQLRKLGNDDGDRHKCSVHIQKHLFESLYIMSRESAWLIEELKDSSFTSPSSKEDCNKILDIIRVFISKFKESMESLDQNLVNDHLMQLNDEILADFGGCIKNLQEQGVERKSVAETLLGCFLDVVNMFYKTKDTSSSSIDQCALFSESAKETSQLINEAVEKLMSVRSSDLTGGGSPLGCMVLWRILFESSLINLRLDLIYEKHSETVNLGVKLLDAATNDQLDQIRMEIDKLLSVGESVLADFVAMQKTVAEVTYTLGDAFITGGAGMSPGTSSKVDDQVKMDFIIDDFPWDKHNVRVRDSMDLTSIPHNVIG